MPTLVPAEPSRLRKLRTLAISCRGAAKARITAPTSVRSLAGIHPSSSPARTRVAAVSPTYPSAMGEPTGRRATVAGGRPLSGEGAIREWLPAHLLHPTSARRQRDALAGRIRAP